MGRGNPIPTAVRVAVDERDGRRCLRCGSPSREQHHRQRRREGGHRLSSLVSLCSACHRWVHAHPAQAREAGFIVSVYAADPSQTPLDAYYGRVLLTDDGSTAWAPPPQPSASMGTS